MRDTIVTIKASDGELYGGHVLATFDRGGRLHAVIFHRTDDGGEMALEGRVMQASDGTMVPIEHGDHAAALARRYVSRVTPWQTGEQAAEMAAETAAADALYGFDL
jgi:hypothetical protein